MLHDDVFVGQFVVIAVRHAIPDERATAAEGGPPVNVFAHENSARAFMFELNFAKGGNAGVGGLAPESA